MVKVKLFHVAVIFLHIDKKQPGKEGNKHEGDIETNQ